MQDARNPSQLRLYYSLYCTEPAVRHPTTNSTLIASALSVAISSDGGSSWTKPTLGQVTFRGNKRNNLVLLDQWHNGSKASLPRRCGVEFGYGCELEGGSVWVDKHAPPDQRYKNVAKSHWPSGQGGIKAWVSSDGYEWKFHAAWDNLGTVDTQEISFFDDDIGEYVMYTRDKGGCTEPWHCGDGDECRCGHGLRPGNYRPIPDA